VVDYLVQVLTDPTALYELVRWGGYVALVAIVFTETGLLIGFFLPGDSLLITAGLVAAAGGLDVAGMSGEPSHRMRWPDVIALEPDVVVLAPCGFDLDRTLSEVVPLDLSAHLLGTPARQESRVFAVDANAMFSRPSPRVVDGVEVLAHLLHPGEYPDPGAPWSRIRL